MKPIITLLGYRHETHSHFWPQTRFFDVFKHAGYDVEWIDLSQLRLTDRPRIYICWNQPACDVLVNNGIYREKDVIIQKLTSLGAGDEHVNWGTDPLTFFKNFSWNTYRRVEEMYDRGINIHAFGCLTDYESFPEKARIVNKLGNRIHWFNWGPCLYNWDELQAMKPRMTDLSYTVAYCGML